MTNISKKKLPKKTRAALWNQFCIVSTKLTRKNSSIVFSELLGPEERVMLANRLAAIFMCIEGYAPYKISRLLMISPTTASAIAGRYAKGEFSELSKLLKADKKNYDETWELLGKILRMGLPPKVSAKRWQYVLPGSSS